MQGNDESWFDLLLENLIASASSLPFPYLHFIISLHPLLFFLIYNTHIYIFWTRYWNFLASLFILLKWSSSHLNPIKFCSPFSFRFLYFLVHWTLNVIHTRNKTLKVPSMEVFVLVFNKRSLFLIFLVFVSFFLTQKVTHVSAVNYTKPHRQVSSLRAERIQTHLNKINKTPVFTILVWNVYVFLTHSNAFVGLYNLYVKYFTLLLL